jgi:hypothetical protein
MIGLALMAASYQFPGVRILLRFMGGTSIAMGFYSFMPVVVAHQFKMLAKAIMNYGAP